MKKNACPEQRQKTHLPPKMLTLRGICTAVLAPLACGSAALPEPDFGYYRGIALGPAPPGAELAQGGSSVVRARNQGQRYFNPKIIATGKNFTGSEHPGYNNAPPVPGSFPYRGIIQADGIRFFRVQCMQGTHFPGFFQKWQNNLLSCSFWTI